MSVKYAILNALMWATMLAFPLQCVIDPSSENIVAAAIVALSGLSVLAYIKWGTVADDQPLATIALLGFCVTSQLGALLVQTGFWTPLRLSLYNPLYTFSHLAFYQAIALVMLVVYRFFQVPGPQRVGVVRGLLSWAGSYRAPSSQVVWFMGLVGLASFIASAHEGVAARIAGGFNFLAWGPFLLPIFAREIGPSYGNARRNNFFLAIYTMMVVFVGIGLNVRVIMFIGLVTVGLLYLLIGLRSRRELHSDSLTRIGVVALILLALSGPLSDLATSMAIARGARGHVSPVEMIKKTFAVWRRPSLIAEYRRETSAVARFAAYDEHYVANPILARFVETKFHDNQFHFASLLTTQASKDQLRAVTIDAIWAILPTPILKTLGVAVDKADIDFSIGDYMAYLSRGVTLGGRKTGSMFAQGEVILGPLFPIVYAVSCLFLYALMNLLTFRRPSGIAELSPLAMMTLWSFFYRGITSDAVNNSLVFIFRNFLQTIVVYTMIFCLARLLFGFVFRQRTSMSLGLPQAT
jgi:hypothetical protein